MHPVSEILIRAFEARIAWEKLPAEFRKSRNGWAGYKGDHRITKFFFSEDGAREAATEWEASHIKIESDL